MPEMRRQIQIVPSPQALTQVASELITAAAALAIGQRQFFRIALAGGSTPKAIYAALAADAFMDWRPWQLFWSDERCVPPAAAESNYRMAKEALLDRLATPPRWVVRMAGEGEPAAAAAAYERAVRELVPANPAAGTGDTPRFDLILLGMGSDGHTASLFPHTSALAETGQLVVANPVPQLQTTRLTFTYPLLNAARRLLVLVSGAEKAEALQAVLEGPPAPNQFPSQGLEPVNGTVTWLVDADAAAKLRAHTFANPGVNH